MIDPQAFIGLTGIRRVMVLRDLPLPPSVNARMRQNLVARLKAGSAVKKFYADVAWLIPRSRVRAFGKEDRLAVMFTFSQGKKGRRADIPNYEKAMSDALTRAHIWHDDGQIDVLLIERGPRLAVPAAHIVIGVLPEESE